MALQTVLVTLTLALSMQVVAAQSLASGPSGPAWAELSVNERQALQPLQGQWGEIDSQRKQKWRDVASRYPAQCGAHQFRRTPQDARHGAPDPLGGLPEPARRRAPGTGDPGQQPATRCIGSTDASGRAQGLGGRWRAAQIEHRGHASDSEAAIGRTRHGPGRRRRQHPINQHAPHPAAPPAKRHAQDSRHTGVRPERHAAAAAWSARRRRHARSTARHALTRQIC